MPTYGLIGYPLTHSFSRRYFTQKFADLGLADSHRYLNFELPSLGELHPTLSSFPDIAGCNVTIPYKQQIIPYLDSLDPVAERIGAVNTLRFSADGIRGYNTDHSGFRDDLTYQLQQQGYATDLRGTGALILGTGGASLAVREALQEMGASVTFVSRNPGDRRITYADVDDRILASHRLVVNTTPLGTYPAIEGVPALPFALLTRDHFCYDLVYNPAITTFLRLSAAAGAGTANGLGMLHRQAEKAWEIWNGE